VDRLNRLTSAVEGVLVFLGARLLDTEGSEDGKKLLGAESSQERGLLDAECPQQTGLLDTELAI
jgi:hypothetical protein